MRRARAADRSRSKCPDHSPATSPRRSGRERRPARAVSHESALARQRFPSGGLEPFRSLRWEEVEWRSWEPRGARGSGLRLELDSPKPLAPSPSDDLSGSGQMARRHLRSGHGLVAVALLPSEEDDRDYGEKKQTSRDPHDQAANELILHR